MILISRTEFYSQLRDWHLDSFMSIIGLVSFTFKMLPPPPPPPPPPEFRCFVTSEYAPTYIRYSLSKQFRVEPFAKT